MLPPPQGGGCLAANVMQFARMLRRAGIPVGPGQVIDAQAALCHIDLTAKAEVHAALRAVMATRREQHEVFDAAFALFWRNPERAIAESVMAALDGARRQAEPQKPKAGSRRAAEAMAPRERREPPKQEPEREHLEAALLVSAEERLRKMDFEAMSEEEVRAARAAIARLRLPFDELPTRRFRPDPLGPRADLRATLRQSLREGGDLVEIARKRRRTRTPPLVVLADISGSMARYAAVLLAFLHAVANDRARVHVFLFGTRLTNVTRALRHRDPEVAFQMVANIVPDWSGGTRIGETLHTFNREWGRRVLGQGATVLLITDGLDREGGKGLAEEAERLSKSCRRLIWLNPLLRWEGFEPKAAGIRAILPHVDDFRPVHNIESLQALVHALSGPASQRRWRKAA
ncbi:VWA domain-containing protein [Elioraea tepida]|uniref:VWA domain-containing protein n=2 Tax=Elioraea tepida TaxID=2843330 RepID=A0A975U2U4_9PROT|nr:VWA domain-containing protein [Elioraea tepida]